MEIESNECESVGVSRLDGAVLSVSKDQVSSRCLISSAVTTCYIYPCLVLKPKIDFMNSQFLRVCTLLLKISSEHIFTCLGQVIDNGILLRDPELQPHPRQLFSIIQTSGLLLLGIR